MKKIVPILFASAFTTFAFSQQQIGNSDFEDWEVVANPDMEPLNWNSFLTSDGDFSQFANNQLTRETDVRPGSTGTYSAHIFSVEIFSVVANGNLTVGRINMGAIDPGSANNYNSSITADANFSETLTDTPDSLVFWVKYTPIDGATLGKVATILHDNYDYRDGPQVHAGSTPHTVATATETIATTNGQWVRKSIPFDYVGPASTNTHILITFTTSAIAGGGDDNDQMWIDDVELIYNPTSGIGELEANDVAVAVNDGQLSILSDKELSGTVAVYAANGQLVQTEVLDSSMPFNHEPGIYFVQLETPFGTISKKIVHYQH